MKPDVRDALRRYYQQNTDYRDDLARHDAAYHAGFLAFVSRWLSPRVYPRVLDLGCGTAASAVCLQQLGFRVIGTDLSQLFLVEGKRRYGARNLIASDAFSLPFQRERLTPSSATSSSSTCRTCRESWRRWCAWRGPAGAC